MVNDAASLFSSIGTLKQTSERANQYGPTVKRLGKGSLIQFVYNFSKPSHDRTPLVVVTDIMPAYIRGINLHYLTFPSIKKILQTSGMNACNNPTFSYANIKADRYIVSSFRQYKKIGIRNLKILDCSLVLNIMGSVRAIDPQEVEAIREAVKTQLNKVVNQNVAGTSEL